MLYEITVPQFMKMLTNLNSILAKGAAHADAKKYEMDILLQSRLAPDQLNLTRQIHIACDSAKLCVARLTGKDAPVHDDTEVKYPELKKRIEEVIAYLGKFNANDFKDAETKHISQPRWEGKYLTGTEYALQHALPNVYFHVTTAYSILRHNGVEVGKKDFLGEMPYKK
ncbi:MAG: DUF1993 domain-containing protein [Bdellovibrio sp.]|nr:DUF1993 domain-containing protein [Bdellovibrio sp.]